MRFLLDLSVGRKLAATATLSVLMLASMVLLVREQGAAVVDAVASSAERLQASARDLSGAAAT